MKYYNLEDGCKIDISQLKSSRIAKKDYKMPHSKMIIACHDVMIEYNNGLLLVQRDNYPAKGILWPIGGKIERGMNTEDSLQQKVKEECNLELEKIIEIGYARTFFKTDPFGHGKGTDTINFVYFGKGKGELKLDHLHSCPTIVSPKEYTAEFKKKLHPYVQDFMDLALPLIKK